MFKIKSLFAFVLTAVFFFQSGPAHAYLAVKGTQTEEKISYAGMSLAPLAFLSPLGVPGAGGAAAAGGKLIWIIIGSAAAILVVVGVVLILDEEGAGMLHYTTLQEADGLDLGLTAAEVSAFNSNVDVVNAVMDELRYLDSEDLESAWAYYASELGWGDVLRSAVAKMSYHAHYALSQ